VGKGRLYGTAEIADRLGVSRPRAYIISRQRTFPESYEDLEGGSVWLIADVEAWIAEHRPELAEETEGE
jgi:prophage regulatory protein